MINRLLTIMMCVFFTHTTYSQTKIWEITTDIFSVRYSEPLQQLRITLMIRDTLLQQLHSIAIEKL